MPHRRRTRTEITPALVQRVRDLSGGALFNHEIGLMLNLSQSAVLKVQKTHGIPHYNRAEARRAFVQRAQR